MSKTIKVKQPQPLKIPMSGFVSSNGDVTLELRKRLIVCDENREFITALVKAALSSNPVKAEVQFYFYDNLRAYSQLKKTGLLKTEKEGKD